MKKSQYQDQPWAVNSLYIHTPNGIHGWGLCLEDYDVESRIEEFKNLCYKHLDENKVRWFHQSNSDDYQFFEFWTDNQEAIIEESMKIASMMGIDLEIK